MHRPSIYYGGKDHHTFLLVCKFVFQAVRLDIFLAVDPVVCGNLQGVGTSLDSEIEHNELIRQPFAYHHW